MEIEELKQYLLERGQHDFETLSDCFELCRSTKDYKTNKKVRAAAYRLVKNGIRVADADKLYYKTLLFAAPVDFDAYLRYTEHNREDKKQFYIPRRKQLKPVVDALQELEERKIKLLAVSMPPGTGKTTLALFYLTWVAGRHPEKQNLTGSHNNDFLKGAYSECLRMMDPGGEYLWKDVFGVPEYKNLRIINQDAKAMMIDIGTDKKDAKRFGTLEFTSIGSGNAGKVRAENLLYCDDLVEGIEQALSKVQMDKLWQKYTDDLRQRKIGDCVELHIATRWSVHDVIGRLEARQSNDGSAKFIVMPALDENDESNFDYPIDAGFTTAFFREQRDIMDDASWKALYMNQPIEREGQLYIADELRRYFDLPGAKYDGDGRRVSFDMPDAIISVCDTKDRGKDYCVMPIAYQYGQDFYIEGVVCDNSSPEIVESRLASAFLTHNIQLSRFESNSAGGKIAEKVQNEVKDKGGRGKITTKYTTQNKETKIIVNQPWVKEHCLFKDESIIKHDKEYRTFLNFLCSYTMVGRNAHDDVPDAMAQLAEFAQSFTVSKVEVFQRPW